MASDVVEPDECFAQMRHLECELGLLDRQIVAGEVPRTEVLDSEVKTVLAGNTKWELRLLAALRERRHNDAIVPGKGTNGGSSPTVSSRRSAISPAKPSASATRSGSTLGIVAEEQLDRPDALPEPKLVSSQFARGRRLL